MRESERVCVRESERVCERESERECVRESESVCVRERERAYSAESRVLTDASTARTSAESFASDTCVQGYS